MLPTFAGVPSIAVVLIAVDIPGVPPVTRVSPVAAVPSTVDVPSAVDVSKVSSVLAVVDFPAVAASLC